MQCQAPGQRKETWKRDAIRHTVQKASNNLGEEERPLFATEPDMLRSIITNGKFACTHRYEMSTQVQAGKRMVNGERTNGSTVTLHLESPCADPSSFRQ
jgi:hypothetical protein